MFCWICFKNLKNVGFLGNLAFSKFLYNAQCCWFSQILLSLMYSLGTPDAVGFSLGTPGAVGFLKIFKVF